MFCNFVLIENLPCCERYLPRSYYRDLFITLMCILALIIQKRMQRKLFFMFIHRFNCFWTTESIQLNHIFIQKFYVFEKKKFKNCLLFWKPFNYFFLFKLQIQIENFHSLYSIGSIITGLANLNQFALENFCQQLICNKMFVL